MWDKTKFIGFVLLAVGISYIFLTIFMPVISTLADNAATDPSITAFETAGGAGTETAGALNWSTIVIYLLPGLIGLAMIFWKLKFSERHIND